MISSISHLFVYGTLLLDNQPAGIFLKENGVLEGEGHLFGELFDTGDYPAAIAAAEKEAASDKKVFGQVYRLDDSGSILKVTDAYEECSSPAAATDEFLRQAGTVFLPGRRLICWVYFYNRPVSALKAIASGDYRLYRLQQ